MGSALKSGFNSHFILTTKQGNPHPMQPLSPNQYRIICNEIVVGQESQILPAFLLEFGSNACKKEFANWNRVVPSILEEQEYVMDHIDSLSQCDLDYDVSIDVGSDYPEYPMTFDDSKKHSSIFIGDNNYYEHF